ncbi:hypothetical protein F4693_002381 [Sphingomonas endophytica]|uniref:Uncharacterized protein n=1 Tax=Sphingomonas endophytica TaxID=869719 RepID=A0A7X0JD23_9SPHN|nr:hypothetical protein [Sphingomonas endophytica]
MKIRFHLLARLVMGAVAGQWYVLRGASSGFAGHRDGPVNGWR